jgi:hypothetical protein
MKEYGPTDGGGDGDRMIFVELYIDSRLPAPQISFRLPLHGRLDSFSGARFVPGENKLPQ